MSAKRGAILAEEISMLVRRWTAVVVTALLIVVGVVAIDSADPAQAAPAGAFNAEYIISDAQFYDSSSLSEADIQSFLAATACIPRDGVPCLRDYTQTTETRAAAGSNQCAAYSGAANEPASRILAKVAAACGISPKVLLALMQKEQSLVTNPSSWGYAHATGANCPDTPQGCDPAYAGFFTQVYSAAWQFRNYAKYPNSWRYKIGPSYVQYNPDTSCGGTTLNIRNQATANLYIYTPYQPNAAALANLYGSGDGCSTYGNRNFWRLYYDWFGSPTDTSPIGSVENMQAVPGGVGIWGWTVDTDTSGPIGLHVYIDGAFAGSGNADQTWPGVAARFGLGDKHGFALTIPASAGVHRVCVYGLNVGAGTTNTELGCATVRTGGGDPVGAVENAQPQPGGIGIWGFALDRDTIDPIWLHVYVDGRFAGGYRAEVPRADLGGSYPGYGINHGFGITVPASTGTHDVCVYALNEGSGSNNTQLACFRASVGGDPTGAVTSSTTSLKSLTMGGWAVDPDTKDPVWLHVYMDGAFAAGVLANATSSELGIFGAFGTNHGYSFTLPADNGTHRVCIYALNTGSGTANTELGCRDVQVGGNPLGAVENGQPGFASIGVWGWAYDRDTADSIMVHVYMDGKFAAGTGANSARPDASAIPDVYGDMHGYGVTFPASPGSHRVCAFALNVGIGDNNTELGCFTTVVDGMPTGAVENVQTVGGGLGVWGFAVDPDTSAPIDVHVYVDGKFATAARADAYRADLASRYPSLGGAHAFGVVVPVTAGSHRVCAYAINTPSGVNPELGCVSAVRQ